MIEHKDIERGGVYLGVVAFYAIGKRYSPAIIFINGESPFLEIDSVHYIDGGVKYTPPRLNDITFISKINFNECKLKAEELNKALHATIYYKPKKRWWQKLF